MPQQKSLPFDEMLYIWRITVVVFIRIRQNQMKMKQGQQNLTALSQKNVLLHSL